MLQKTEAGVILLLICCHFEDALIIWLHRNEQNRSVARNLV
ncbi:hypothetical protein CI610_00197 [invertebrate metagenome]|uniref:Uncharacterized protein n=1 Tax=invertebrate metagenome TaxID=1711999 RepID=A0A2H9TCB8_9ZZZZ